MKSFKKKVLCTTLALIFICSSIGFATPQTEDWSAIFTNLHIRLDQQTAVASDALILQNKLYVPLDQISSLLHLAVSYDETEHLVSIQQSSTFKDFPDMDPLQGESFVYGEILSVQPETKQLTILQHYDDNSKEVDPTLQVSEDLIIILQRNDKKMNLEFEDLKVGDPIGLVLTAQDTIRGIIINQ